MESVTAHLETLGDDSGLVALGPPETLVRSINADVKTLGDDAGLIALGSTDASEVC